eukprot:10056724-Ditylum_brightwellii.AAC.1
MEPSDTLIGVKMIKEQWKGKVATWHDSTTTSPSGRHLLHFKVLLPRFAEKLEAEAGREMYQEKRI